MLHSFQTFGSLVWLSFVDRRGFIMEIMKPYLMILTPRSWNCRLRIALAFINLFPSDFVVTFSYLFVLVLFSSDHVFDDS